WICSCTTSVGIQWNYSGATDLNDLGEIVGYSSDGAFLWKDGQVAYLQDGAPGSLTASAINNQSQVVGKMTDANNVGTGFLWSRADGAVDINSLLFDTQGWTVTNAADINDAGQIAATGVKDGVTHALLLTPLNTTAELSAAVPVPAAVWLFGSALAGLGAFGRRRLA
ncbi:MAG: VPLPA-CTERM sorting domain-containing protein, partial [Candidatus Methylumidiphilus sp.]